MQQQEVLPHGCMIMMPHYLGILVTESERRLEWYKNDIYLSFTMLSYVPCDAIRTSTPLIDPDFSIKKYDSSFD